MKGKAYLKGKARPHHFMENRRGKGGTSDRFPLLQL